MIMLRRSYSGAVTLEAVATSFPTCLHLRFCCRNPYQKRTRRTLFIAVLGHAQCSGGHSTVAEHELISSPRMGTRHVDVARVARSDFEPGIDINGSFAILNYVETIDVVNVCNGVDVSVVELRGVRGERLQALALTRSPHACR